MSVAAGAAMADLQHGKQQAHRPADLIAVDATSYLQSAHFAVAQRTGPAGRPTGALHALYDLLRALRSDHPEAEHLACVFEPGSTTSALNSDRSDAALPPQLGAARSLVAALGWNVLEVPGGAAVDLLATLCMAAARRRRHALVVGCRARLGQLVAPSTTWREALTGQLHDPAAIEGKFGVPSHQLPDYLALVGDLVDGIPGAPRCGPKTARALLREYASVGAMVANRHALEGTNHAHLAPHCADIDARFRQLLAKPDEIALEELAPAITARAADPDALAAFAREYGVPELADHRRDAPGRAGQGATALDYVCTPQALQALAEQLPAQPVALALAITSANLLTARLAGLALSMATGTGVYIPVAHADGTEQLDANTVLSHLRSWLQDPTAPKIIYDARTAQHVFDNHGVPLAGVVGDPHLGAYVLTGARDKDLRRAVRAFLRRADAPALAHPVVITSPAQDSARVGQDLASGADLVRQINQAIDARITSKPGLMSLYREIEMPVGRAIRNIERHGMLIDTARLDALMLQQNQAMELATVQAWEETGLRFDLDDDAAVETVLYDHLRLGPTSRRRKAVSTKRPVDKDTLQGMSHRSNVAGLILKHRELKLLRARFAGPLRRAVNPSSGRIHTTLGLAATGRLTSSAPSLHNVPVRTEEGRRIREAFIAPPGCVIVSADYSQVEMRILAHLSGDGALCAVFDQGLDIHNATAAELFDVASGDVTPLQRRYAKTFNQALVNGAGAQTLARTAGISLDQAKQAMQRYFARFPGVKEYLDNIPRNARRCGYVETIFGRRIWLPDLASGNPKKRHRAERQAINVPMQGTAADIIKVAMVAITDWLDEDLLATKLIMQVHDELVFEVPDDELPTVLSAIPALMQTAATLRIPLIANVGYGPNWARAH